METEASLQALVALSKCIDTTPPNEVSTEDLQRIVDGLKAIDD